MNTEKIIALIENTDWRVIQKTTAKGFIQRAEEAENERQADRLLISQVYGGSRLQISKIVLSTEEVKIFTISGTDEWDIKYPFRSVFLNNKGNWQRANTVSPTLDLAYLVYLQYKYLGLNSQFADFAMKMLEINPQTL